MSRLGPFSPSTRLPGWAGGWIVFTVLAACLTGLFWAFVLKAFGAGLLVALVVAALVGAWLIFHPRWLPFFLLFLFVAAACPHLRLGGAMDAARWAALAAATYYLGVQFLVRRTPFKFRAEHLPVIFFCVWAAATTAWSGIPLLTFVKSLAFAIMIAFCFLYAQHFSENSRTTVESFFWNLVFIDALVIPASLLVRWIGLEVYRYPDSNPEAMYGLFGNPNSLGLFAALLLPILFWALNQRPRWRYSLAFLTLANLYCLLASRSRASYAAAFAVLGLYLVLRRPKLVVGGAVASSMALTLLVACWPTTAAALMNKYLYKERETAFASRLEHWSLTLSYVREKWFLGYGLGVTAGAGANWEFSARGRSGETHVQGSSLLSVWEETGLVGLLLIGLYPFWIAAWAARVLFRQRRARDPGLVCLLVLTSAVMASIINMLFEEWLLSPGFFATMFFWILIFLLARELRAEQQRRQPAAAPGLPYASTA